MEEKVGLEGRESLELYPAYLALVETTKTPGRGALLGSDACLVKYGYSIFVGINTVFIFWLLCIIFGCIKRFSFKYWSYRDAWWKSLLQSGSAAEDLVLILSVKELVDVGVGVEEGLGGRDQSRVLEGESSLDKVFRD